MLHLAFDIACVVVCALRLKESLLSTSESDYRHPLPVWRPFPSDQLAIIARLLPPRRCRNGDPRAGEYLTEAEVSRQNRKAAQIPPAHI